MRQKFIAGAKKYIGVPYARKYHPVGTPLHDAPLFLDCCALIRRVVLDLREDFGFTLGRWNQAYQFDVAGPAISREDMQPGDLIFYEGVYNNPKSKPQKFGIVHVEVFLGGCASVGSRYGRVGVEQFDNFEFESKNYHSVKHHFRSLDAWLSLAEAGGKPVSQSGTAWADDRPAFVPGAHSLFSRETDEDQECGADGSELMPEDRDPVAPRGK